MCIVQEKNATSTSWLHCSRDNIYIYIYTYAYIRKTQIDVHSYQRSILKSMSHFYITDCTSDLHPFLKFSNRSPMFSNLWLFLTFSNRCPMTSLKYALTLNITNKSATDPRIRKGCRPENTFKSELISTGFTVYMIDVRISVRTQIGVNSSNRYPLTLLSRITI